MNTALIQTAQRPPAGGALATDNAGPADGGRCFHCGDPCAGATFMSGGRSFCCAGCRAVHDLLAGAGLEHFYRLARHPGIRVRGTPGRERWSFLDDPELQVRLLDFTNGKLSRITLRLPAIHCVSCVWLLENLFRLHPGVGRATVHFARREATFDFDPGRIRLSELAALIASLGYEPDLTLGELGKAKPGALRRRPWIQLGIAGFAFANIMLFSLPAYFGLDSFSGPLFEKLFRGLSLALAAPVLIYSASDYWQAAWRSWRQRTLTVDVPIALGLAALYGRSAAEILSGRGAGYLDSLVGLVFFLLCGRAFQQKTHERLAFDRDYKSFFPLSVVRRRGDREESIPITRLRVGDRIVLRCGELIPADAELAGGNALIDYSFVTGESEPVAKGPGDYLYAGGRLAGGSSELKIVKPVSQSYLSSLWNHESFQKSGRENLNTLTNRYSRWFTLIVIAIALGAALAWLIAGDATRAAKAFISVLIVACPCALALAAPFTLGTAQRWLNRIGVFIRNPLVLERMARVNAIVFDKTGTLTTSAPGRVRCRGDRALGAEPLTDTEADQVYSLAARSAHPHSIHIFTALRRQDPPRPVEAFEEKPGCGIAGTVDGRRLLLGSRQWLQARGVAAPPGTAGKPGPREPEACAAPGAAVHLAIGGRYRGAFVLADELRPDIERLLEDLGARCEIALLSGDHERERARFGNLFGGGSQLEFNQTPLDKLAFIQRRQQAGRIVMMVGDGLNDAGALKQSDVGVAVVERIGLFSPASDVILEGCQVPRLDRILTLARRSVGIVRLGLGFSAGYNLLGVGIAATGMLSPLICAVLMPLSSVSVVVFACAATSWTARRLGLKPDATRAPETALGQPELQPAN